MTTATDFLTPVQRSDLMRRVRSKETKPELLLMGALRERSISFETNCADLSGKPDIVFREGRLVVFVDGEFWHGGQWRKRGLNTLDSQFPNPSKRAHWIAKIKGNQARDLAQTATLLSDGWTVIRLWASEIEKDASAAVDMIVASLETTGTSPASYLPPRNVGEFFAGIGLARLGLAEDNWQVSFANDHSEDKITFYKENHTEGDARLDNRDIHDVRSDDIPTVALATACFPCTDLSLAGAQRGLEPGTESSAYLKFTSLLSEMGERRPPFVLLENVVGMIHSREGLDFTICLKRLQSAGYTVDPFLLDAKWFVPQSRPRLFVVAVRDDLKPSGHLDAKQIAEASILRPTRLSEFIAAHPDLPWSLRPLPLPQKSTYKLKDILESIPDTDPRWWTQERATKLYRQMSKRHRKKVRQMMAAKRAKYGTVFRRMRNEQSTAELRTDGLAGCLRTPKGGSARQILFRASNGKYSVRLLTPRECARLMGADDIQIPESVSVNTALFAFGDGVCVPVVQWIAENYLTPLATELIRGCVLRLPASI